MIGYLILFVNFLIIFYGFFHTAYKFIVFSLLPYIVSPIFISASVAPCMLDHPPKIFELFCGSSDITCNLPFVLGIVFILLVLSCHSPPSG